MARPSRERVSPLEALPSNPGAPVLPGVSARPTGAFEAVSPNPEIDGLLRGLSVLNPALQAGFSDRFERERREGAAARRAGMSAESAALRPRGFVEGFMEANGEVAALEDAAQMEAEWAEGAAKDAPSLDDFLRQRYAARMDGNPDRAFRAGYDKVFSEAASRLRAKHGETQAAAVLEQRYATATTLVETAARRAMADGASVSSAIFASIGEQEARLKLSGQEKNRLLYDTIARLALEGQTSVLELAKMPRPGRAPGETVPALNQIPEYRERLANLQLQSENLRAQRVAAENKRLKEEREAAQDDAYYRVYLLKLEGRDAEAQAALTEVRRDARLWSGGGFDRLVSLERALAGAAEEAARPGVEAAEAEWILRIHTKGPARPHEIAEDDRLTQPARARIIRENRTVLNELRREAREGAVAGAQIRAATFNDPVFQSARDALRKSLASPPSATDPMGVGSAAAQQLRGEAELLFVQWMAGFARAGKAPTQDEVMNKQAQLQVEFQRRLSTVNTFDLKSSNLFPAGSNGPTLTPDLADLIQRAQRGQAAPEAVIQAARQIGAAQAAAAGRAATQPTSR